MSRAVQRAREFLPLILLLINQVRGLVRSPRWRPERRDVGAEPYHRARRLRTGKELDVGFVHLLVELGPSEQGLLDLALVANLSGDVGAEVTACEQATQLAPDSPAAWARLAHALARTDRLTDCLAACERALELADDPEVRDVRDQVVRAAPRELRAA